MYTYKLNTTIMDAKTIGAMAPSTSCAIENPKNTINPKRKMAVSNLDVNLLCLSNQI